MMSDDEDDAHYCLKCHETIEGLENYVKHRKAVCSSRLLNIRSIENPSTSKKVLLPVKPLKADDFFSSLELQSSSKKVPIPSTTGKQPFGILTRSKTSGGVQKKVFTEDQSKSGKNAWIGGEQNSKLLKPVDITTKHAYLKKDQPDMDEVEDSNDFIDSEDEYYDTEEDDNIPPKTFTGGKWKPSSPISEWTEYIDNSTGGKWRSKSGKVFLTPPQNHTKGKWKPMSPIQTLKEIYPPSDFKESDNNFFILSEKEKTENDNENVTNTWSTLSFQQPPPNYTKGKWKPTTPIQKTNVINEEKCKRKITEVNRPFRKVNGRVQYFCIPCNRSLASKVVYVRHLKSELHLKRSGEENDLEDLNASPIKENKQIEEHVTKSSSNQKRFRRKKYIKCEVCRSRVMYNQMGKHLISHYHCRKGDITTIKAKQMVLDNIDQIIFHSPFQCGLCKFYCNTTKDFMTHWNSQTHVEKATNSSGYFLCSFCQFSTHDNSVMQNHLTSEEHSEVISVINRSVPIVIRNIIPVKCQTCSVSFLLNIQLRKHCELNCHKYSDTATDTYQEKLFCSICKNMFKSKIAFQRHVSTFHDEKYYFCSLCEVSFKTQDEINEHKKTTQHRMKLQIKSKTAKGRSCEYCSIKVDNFHDLKLHLQEVHPEHTYNCPYCDKKFTISQDLIVHIRSKKCKPTKEEKAHSCERCYYSTDSLSDLWFHNALHEGPVKDTPLLSKTSKISDFYKCVVCSKTFPKASLKFHLKNHTDEKSYKCEKCGIRFARKNNWKLHMKYHDAKESNTSFLCSVCGKAFISNYVLQKHMDSFHSLKLFNCAENECSYIAKSQIMLSKHMKIHNAQEIFRCEKCSYVGKSAHQLRRHLTAHEAVKKFTCSQCPFSTRLGFHLKRHERIHSGSKPYVCPHCPYRCNNLENLRKHVLTTSKHQGKSLYKCKFCPTDKFQSNFAKEFKAHLMTFHGNVFRDSNNATSYIAGIYDSVESSIKTEIKPKDVDMDDTIILPLELDQATTSTNNVNDKPSTVTQETPDDLLSMFIITKDDEIVYLDKDSWNSVASFDVEESQVLCFNEDEGSTLFQEHFQS